jgi:hypothetical protein
MDDGELSRSFNCFLSSLQVFHNEADCQADAWATETSGFSLHKSGM